MINWSDFDRLMMRMALIEARRGLLTAKENPRVGCVIARAREILALGYHAVTGGPHAEINALSQVNDANGATCYVTLEPCSHEGKTGPCADALIEAADNPDDLKCRGLNAKALAVEKFDRKILAIKFVDQLEAIFERKMLK